MFVGQIQAAPYMGKMGISAVRANLPFASMQTTPTQYDRVEIGTRSQETAYSGTYKPNSDQMRALGNTSYTWAAPDSRLQAELLPPSEQLSYTEEDALINQYMKQSRIDGYFDGDTFVRTSSEPVKLILKDDIAKADLEKFRGELAEKGLGADIDWRGVQEDFVQIGVGFDNIERFEQKADYLASRYAVLKDRIQTQYTGEQQEAELQRLEQIYTEAKEEMANTYAESIGGFFEDLGQSGAAEDILSMKIRNSADIAIPTTTQPHIQKEQTFFAYSVRPSPKAREITEVPPMPKTVPTAMKIRNTGGRQRYRRHQNVIVGLADKKRICQIVNQHHQHSGHSRQGIF